MRNVLLVKAGEAAASIRHAVGDYDRWFSDALERGQANVRLHTVAAWLGERLPPAREYDAVWVSGSSLSVIDQTEWMKRTAEYLRQTVEDGHAVLGVCFGHQLLGHAFGGEVIVNPAGREIGTIELALTPEGRADPLFAGVPDTFALQATHQDIVRTAPSKTAKVLASNGNTAFQAAAWSKRARSVQFHPELSADGIRAVIDSRVEAIDREGQLRGMGRGEWPKALLAGVRETPWGVKILANFLEHFV